MKVYYNDGGVLDCVSLRISSPELLIADDIYYIRMDEIYLIEDDTEDEPEDMDDLVEDDEWDEIARSSTGGDYSPSNPWDAPGMSPSDFI